VTFRIVINCAATGIAFGMWQQNPHAGVFVFLALGALFSLVDYWHHKETHGKNSQP
jgi:lipoprotein signal peptidase